jgi:isocitrate dehydrogenase kinase/phosphatase
VFYDYDEVQYLLDMTFRAIPQPENWDDMLSAEPWYPVHPGDVFPEQIATFVTAQPDLRQLLQELHPELLDAEYWQQKQSRIRSGIVEDVFAYPQQQRFISLYPQEFGHHG